jgi:hypothetical protein
MANPLNLSNSFKISLHQKEPFFIVVAGFQSYSSSNQRNPCNVFLVEEFEKVLEQ